jgi:hypothetical protein
VALLAGAVLLVFFIGLVQRDPARPLALALSWAQWPAIALYAWLWHRCGRPEVAGSPAAFWPAALPVLALVFSLVVHRGDPLFWDAATSWSRADLVREGHGLLAEGERFSIFYYLLALLQGATGGSVAWVRMILAIVYLAGFGALALLGWRLLGHGTPTYILALAAVTPMIHALAHWLYVDLFTVLLGAWTALAFLTALRRRRLRWLLASLALLGLTVLTREHGLLVLPLLVALWLADLDWRRWRRKWWDGGRPGRRAAVLLGAGLALALLGWGLHGLYTFYLPFWRRIEPKPVWSLTPFVIVPGHPRLDTSQQLAVIWSLARQQLTQLTGTGLLLTAMLGLVQPRTGRTVGYVGLVLLAAIMTASGFLFLRPATLNQLLSFDPLLFWLAPAFLAAILAGALRGVVRLAPGRGGVALWIWFTAALLVFSLAGKVTRAGGGQPMGALDWRYPLFAQIALLLLAALAMARVHQALGHLARWRWLAPLLPSLVVVCSLVLGSDAIRQTSTFGSEQLAGVREAQARAERSTYGIIVTGWPYFYPTGHPASDLGPYRWRSRAARLRHWPSDPGKLAALADSGAIALYDTRLAPFRHQLLKEAEVATFSAGSIFLRPLRPGVRLVSSPTVCVADLATWMPPSATGYHDDFATGGAGEPDAWQGLGGPEVWQQGLTVRWTVASQAWRLFAPADSLEANCAHRLRLRAMSFAAIDSQSVRALLNERDLGARALGDGWTELDWAIPAGTLQMHGFNRLVLRIGRTLRPRDVPGLGSNDPRPLGVALDWLRIEPD